jgi:hypothetical protein
VILIDSDWDSVETLCFFSPVYVDENSDLSLVARRVSWGKLVNCGQTCIAPDYVMCKKDVQVINTYTQLNPFFLSFFFQI